MIGHLLGWQCSDRSSVEIGCIVIGHLLGLEVDKLLYQNK